MTSIIYLFTSAFCAFAAIHGHPVMSGVLVAISMINFGFFIVCNNNGK